MIFTTYIDGDDYVVKAVDSRWVQETGINYKDEIRVPKKSRFLKRKIRKAQKVLQKRHDIAKESKGEG